MKIKNIELYENGDKWVVSWEDNSSHYPRKDEAFRIKREAQELYEMLKQEARRQSLDYTHNSAKLWV